MTMNAYLTLESDTLDSLEIKLRNDWVFANIQELQSALDDIWPAPGQSVTFKCGGLKNFDLTGAWLLYDKSLDIEEEGMDAHFEGFKAGHFKFLQHIFDVAARNEYIPGFFDKKKEPFVRNSIERVGQFSSEVVESVGQISRSILDGTKNVSLLVIGETIRQVDETGVKAIPIVFVICFLMGIVLAFQAANQLEQFGASIFVVDLVAISVLREIGILLAAIMVAGRSGSAFAAALGTMKLNEEVDALRVLGLNPNQILILPRVLGLVISLPLIGIIADVAGLMGGLFICSASLDISFVQYVERLAIAVQVPDVMVGLSKAPVFAVLIAATGTLRGMQVKNSAEELGRLTTIAVVQSIFLIILSDAFFTVLYSRLGI
jgi:phospholipid/cholesterol/gamma-HCH transport system permease protein